MDEELSLDGLSDEELEDLLFEEEETSSNGIFNLPTMTGLSIIAVGIAYLFQELGFLGGISLAGLVSTLPWIAGIIIILLGFGVLSWRPNRKKPKKKARKAVEVPTGEKKVVVETTVSNKKKRLRKSHNKKIAGVAAGIGEYLNIDPTLVRIAFVIGTFFNGVGILIYFALAMIMSKPEPLSAEERITIIRDS